MWSVPILGSRMEFSRARTLGSRVSTARQSPSDRLLGGVELCVVWGRFT